MELSDGTRSVKEIAKTLVREFDKSPPEEEMLTRISTFLSECEKKNLVELRKTPAEKVRHESKDFTPADVEKLIEENSTVLIGENASFEQGEDGSLMTYSVKQGEYLVLTEEEKEILTALLKVKPLQEILSDISQKHWKAKQILTEFVCELLNHKLAKVQK